MNKFKKIVFMVSFVAVCGLFFNFNAPVANAITVDEIRAQIAELMAQISELQKQLNEANGQAVWCHDFNRNLKYGDTGEDVVALQKALGKQGFEIILEQEEWLHGLFDEGNVGSFGQFTASAVVGFQQKYEQDILAPWGLEYGTGYVGKTTREKLNGLYGCEIEVPEKSITVLSPNGGEQWVVGETRDIMWETQGFEANAALIVTLVNDELFNKTCRLIDGYVNAGQGEYLWKIGTDDCSNYYGDKLRIKIGESEGMSQPYISDISDDYFSIVAAETQDCVDSDGGENIYVRGTTAKENVKFTDKCNIRIWNGDNYQYNGATSCTGKNCCVDEGICDASYMYEGVEGLGHKILQCPNGCVDGACVRDEAPSITVLSPNGGEQWVIGETYDITWESIGVDKVVIAFCVDLSTGISCYNIAETSGGIDAELKKYNWWLDPSNRYFQAFDKFKIKIRDAYDYSASSTHDLSDNYFSIVAAEIGYDKCEYGGGWSEPKSAAERCGWPLGAKGDKEDCCCCYIHSHIHDLGKIFQDKQVLIEYTPGLFKDCVSKMVVYSSVDGENWKTVLTTSVKQGTSSPKTTYDKTIDVPGEFRYIKIYIPRCYNDYSSAKVIEDIQPSITVTSPNGGEQWVAGQTYSIKWTSGGIVANDVVEVYLFKGNSIDHRLGRIPNSGQLSWTIGPGQAARNDYRIQVEYSSNCVIADDFSDSYFSIVAATTCSSLQNQTSCLDNSNCYWDQQYDNCRIYDSTKQICSDPDNGKDIYTQAHTYGFRQSYADERDKRIRTGGKDACIGDKLREHYCANDYYIRTYDVECPNGCENGACVRDEIIPSVSLISNPQMSNNKVTIYTNDEIVFTGTPSNLEGEMIQDYTRAFFFDMSVFVCQNTEWEMTCTAQKEGFSQVYIELYKDGKIYKSNVVEVTVKKALTCVDSDWGKNYYVKGTATGYENNQLITSTDGCRYDNKTLAEVYCDGSNLKVEQYVCPNVCEDGACVAGDEIYCGAVGSKSQGWYQNTGTDRPELIRWDNSCAGCYAVCKFVGSRSEGWYSSCNNILIKFDKCGEEITPSITVLSPNGGEQWVVGETYQIKWEPKGIDLVKIYIINPSIFGSGSTNYITPNGQPVSAASGYYNWTISEKQLPVGVGQGCVYKIRVFDAENSTITDKSNGHFSIAEVVACTDSDNGKDYYTKGITHGIQKNGSIYVTSTDICMINNTQLADEGDSIVEYYCDGVYREISYYKCPNGCVDGACKRDETTSITVISPNGGERFHQGDFYTIAWESSGSIDNVKITICMTQESYNQSSSGETRCDVGVITNNNGSYSSQFGGAAILGDYTVQVEDASNSAVYDASDNYFSIIGSDTTTLRNIENQLASIAHALFQVQSRINKLFRR